VIFGGFSKHLFTGRDIAIFVVIVVGFVADLLFRWFVRWLGSSDSCFLSVVLWLAFEVYWNCGFSKQITLCWFIFGDWPPWAGIIWGERARTALEGCRTETEAQSL